MLRTWPGQTYEEWLKEYERDDALTPEERKRELDEYIKQIKDERKKYDEAQQQQKQTPEEVFKNCDHPNSLENSEATIVWVVVMLVGTIFKGNWIIWIVATVIWLKHLNRHQNK